MGASPLFITAEILARSKRVVVKLRPELQAERYSTNGFDLSLLHELLLHVLNESTACMQQQNGDTVHID